MFLNKPRKKNLMIWTVAAFITILFSILAVYYINKKINASASVNNTAPVFEALKGKWFRPDGGYVIDIKNISSDGKLDSAYYNPNPIKVSKAVATNEGGNTKVFVELRDEGYPGCTYKLVYQPQNDQLYGIYYQAAIQESFKIFFVRMK